MRRPRCRRTGLPLLLLAATLIATYPVQASEASMGEPRLLVHPTHVPSDGTPFSVRVTLQGEPDAAHEVKLWLGSRHRQASQTWTGASWLRADRYAVEATPDHDGTWTGWVHGRVNPESAGYPDLVESRDRALLSLRVRGPDGDAMGTTHRTVNLLHEGNATALTIQAPANASHGAVRDPDGGWLAVAPAEPDGLPDGDPPIPGWVQLPVPPGWNAPVVPLTQSGSNLDPVAPPPPPTLRIASIMPRGYAPDEPLESVTMTNPTNRTVDLEGVCLAAQGRACFLAGTLAPGGRLTVARDASAWRNATGTPARDLASLWMGPDGFTLPDEAGSVELRHLTRPMDRLDLAGPPVRPGEVRQAGWSAGDPRHRVGQTRWAPLGLDVSGTAWPALAPRGSYALMREVIQGAEGSIRGSVYMLTSPSIARDLADALDRGVDMHLLVDGSPVGGLPDEERTILQGLVDRGAEVHTLRSTETFRRRYDALHAKTLVVDGGTVVVGSENWARSSHPPGGGRGNRGWVLAVHNATLAQAVGDLLRADANATRPDVHPVPGDPSDPFPPRPLTRPPAPPEDIELSNASVALVVSPDNALMQVRDLLRAAERTVRLELLSLDPSWGEGWGPLVTDLVDAAHRGVHVRVLLDGTYTDPATGAPRNAPARDLLNQVADDRELPLEARILQGDRFLKVHSKGLVVDGEQVLVGSMNWGPSGFLGNREVGLVVEDPRVAGIYQRGFDALWWGEDETPWRPPRSPVPFLGVATVMAVLALAAWQSTRWDPGG